MPVVVLHHQYHHCESPAGAAGTIPCLAPALNSVGLRSSCAAMLPGLSTDSKLRPLRPPGGLVLATGLVLVIVWLFCEYISADSICCLPFPWPVMAVGGRGDGRTVPTSRETFVLTTGGDPPCAHHSVPTSHKPTTSIASNATLSRANGFTNPTLEVIWIEREALPLCVDALLFGSQAALGSVLGSCSWLHRHRRRSARKIRALARLSPLPSTRSARSPTPHARASPPPTARPRPTTTTHRPTPFPTSLCNSTVRGLHGIDARHHP